MVSEIFRTYVAGLLSPTFLISILLLMGLLLLWRNKKSAKYLLSAGVLFFIICGTAPLRFSLFHLSEFPPTIVPNEYDYVVVLGARIVPNDKHPVSSQIGSSLLSRLSYGIALVHSHPKAKLIVTGNGTGDIPEAEFMKRFALEMGVPQERIILEKESMNTLDHPKYLYHILKDKKFLIVTSAFHMKRALSNFEAHGLKGHPAPTDFANKKEGLNLESLMIRGENFAVMDKWMTEFYSTLWTHVRKAFNI